MRLLLIYCQIRKRDIKQIIAIVLGSLALCKVLQRCFKQCHHRCCEVLPEHSVGAARGSHSLVPRKPSLRN